MYGNDKNLDYPSAMLVNSDELHQLSYLAFIVFEICIKQKA